MKIYRNLIAIGEQDGVIIALDITPLILGAGITTGLGVGIITIRYLNRRMRRLVAEGKRPAPKSRLIEYSSKIMSGARTTFKIYKNWATILTICIALGGLSIANLRIAIRYTNLRGGTNLVRLLEEKLPELIENDVFKNVCTNLPPGIARIDDPGLREKLITWCRRGRYCVIPATFACKMLVEMSLANNQKLVTFENLWKHPQQVIIVIPLFTTLAAGLNKLRQGDLNYIRDAAIYVGEHGSLENGWINVVVNFAGAAVMAGTGSISVLGLWYRSLSWSGAGITLLVGSTLVGSLTGLRDHYAKKLLATPIEAGEDIQKYGRPYDSNAYVYTLPGPGESIPEYENQQFILEKMHIEEPPGHLRPLEQKSWLTQVKCYVQDKVRAVSGVEEDKVGGLLPSDTLSDAAIDNDQSIDSPSPYFKEYSKPKPRVNRFKPDNGPVPENESWDTIENKVTQMKEPPKVR